MQISLAGRTVLVTGSGTGIGQAIAVCLANEGATVVVNDLDAGRCAETASLIARSGGQAHVAAFDVGDREAVREASASIEPIDILVNNAAVMLVDSPFVDSEPADWERELRVGLFGTLNCTHAFLPSMIGNRTGAVINIVSDAGRIGQEREAAYSAAKGGVIAFTKSIAREVGRHGVTCNAVSPAATDTPLRRAKLARMAESMGQAAVDEREAKVRRAYPLRRIAEADDIAGAVLFFASARSKYVTGQVLSVNGGYAMPG